MWRNLPSAYTAAAASMYYPYDGSTLAGYPFANGYVCCSHCSTLSHTCQSLPPPQENNFAFYRMSNGTSSMFDCSKARDVVFSSFGVRCRCLSILNPFGEDHKKKSNNKQWIDAPVSVCVCLFPTYCYSDNMAQYWSIGFYCVSAPLCLHFLGQIIRMR